MKLLKDNWVLILILLLAFFLRIPSLISGLPTITHPDEPDVVLTSMNLAKDFNPHRFIWPASTLYYSLFFIFGLYFLIGRLFGIFPSLQAFRELYLLDQSSFYLLSRVFVLILGIASICLVYFIVKNLYDKKTALLSSFFLSFFLLHIKYSILALADIPMTFFVLLSLLFIVKLYQTGKLEYYILAGISIGLTIATKYPGGAIFFTFLLAHFLRRPKTLLSKKFIFALILIPLAFIVSTPFSILSFNEFFNQLNWAFFKGFSGEQVGSFAPYSSYIYSFTLIKEEIGILFLALSVIGLIFLILKHRKKEILLLSFPMVYYIFIGNLKILASQYILPIVIFFPIFISIFLIYLLNKLSINKSSVIALIAIFIIISPTTSIVDFHRYQSLPDTRDIALSWTVTNIPLNTKFAYESYSHILPQNKASLLNELEKCEQLQTKCENVKLLLEENKSGYELFKIGYVWNPVSEEMAKDFTKFFRDRKVDYIITTSYQSERFFKEEAKKFNPEVTERAVAYYIWLDNENMLIKEFRPDSKTKGPTIKIYKFVP